MNGEPPSAGERRPDERKRDAPVNVVPTLAAEHVTLSYDERVIVEDLSLAIPTGRITCIVGANACGKSTLLRALARLLAPRAGQVVLDGQAIHRMATKEVAAKLGILPQAPIAPDGITVAELVARGRYPHQKWFRQWRAADEVAVVDAMAATGVLERAARHVDQLSGGQRQRVWIAMALAQGTRLLLLDEPTTYLDMAHQLDVLDLLVDLNGCDGRTIVLVLHDLNQAARYSHHLVAMRAGRVVAQGPPAEIVQPELVRQVFDLDCHVQADPVTGAPLVIPIGRHRGAGHPSPGCLPHETLLSGLPNRG
jgi:iron complex transport system ATP-binding protein